MPEQKLEEEKKKKGGKQTVENSHKGNSETKSKYQSQWQFQKQTLEKSCFHNDPHWHRNVCIYKRKEVERKQQLR